LTAEHTQIDDNLVRREATLDDAKNVIEPNRLVHTEPPGLDPADNIASGPTIFSVV